jgi:sugar phosphate isomerase/epimerase
MLTGGHGTLTWEEAAETFCKAVSPCVAEAKQAGVALGIENASTLFADLHIAHTLRDTVILAEMAGIGVNMDVYGCWTESSLKETIERAIPHLKLVQLSDYTLGDPSLPCRSVPGDGAVPLKRILDWVLSAGYTGGFDFELIGPRIEKEGPLDAIRRAGDYVGKILHELGA